MTTADGQDDNDRQRGLREKLSRARASARSRGVVRKWWDGLDEDPYVVEFGLPANKSRSRAGPDAKVYPAVGVGQNPFKKRNSFPPMEEVDNRN